MSASTQISNIIAEVQNATVAAAGPSRGVQAANYYRLDKSWDPLTPPGHTVYTWTGHQDAAPMSQNVYIPLQMRAYAHSVALAAEQNATPAAGAPAVAAAAPAKVAAAKPAAKAPAAAKAPVVADAATPQEAFSRLDIRVGRVVSVARHPEADKLYIEKIDVGEAEPRQILSGLVEHVPESELLGAHIFVICNLKYAKLKGVESQGMVLCACAIDAAGNKGKVELVHAAAGSAPGERAFVEHVNNVQPDVDINIKKTNSWSTAAPLLKTNGECVACFDGRPLMTKAGVSKAKSVADGMVQ
jgi:methionine--tRNA ligase beta chain